MYAFKRLQSVKSCGRASCQCFEEIRKRILHIPTSNNDDDKNERELQMYEEYHRKCLSSWEYFKKNLD